MKPTQIEPAFVLGRASAASPSAAAADDVERQRRALQVSDPDSGPMPIRWRGAAKAGAHRQRRPNSIAGHGRAMAAARQASPRRQRLLRRPVGHVRGIRISDSDGTYADPAGNGRDDHHRRSTAANMRTRLNGAAAAPASLTATPAVMPTRPATARPADWLRTATPAATPTAGNGAGGGAAGAPASPTATAAAHRDPPAADAAAKTRARLKDLFEDVAT